MEAGLAGDVFHRLALDDFGCIEYSVPSTGFCRSPQHANALASTCWNTRADIGSSLRDIICLKKLAGVCANVQARRHRHRA